MKLLAEVLRLLRELGWAETAKDRLPAVAKFDDADVCKQLVEAALALAAAAADCKAASDCGALLALREILATIYRNCVILFDDKLKRATSSVCRSLHKSQFRDRMLLKFFCSKTFILVILSAFSAFYYFPWFPFISTTPRQPTMSPLSASAFKPVILSNDLIEAHLVPYGLHLHRFLVKTSADKTQDLVVGPEDPKLYLSEGLHVCELTWESAKPNN